MITVDGIVANMGAGDGANKNEAVKSPGGRVVMDAVTDEIHQRLLKLTKGRVYHFLFLI